MNKELKIIENKKLSMEENIEELVMYIFVNKDLKMSSGKMCSQVGHVVQLIVEDIIRNAYEVYPVSENYINYEKWKKNCTKIVLKATEEQLIELIKLKNSKYVIDDGQTQVKPNSLTCVGFVPCSNMKNIAKKYKLL